MPVLPIKTELRCKICAHANRAEMDALLERRSKGEKDDAGARINLAYVLERFAEWGMDNPTKENVTTHWKKHCEVVGTQVVEAQQEARALVLERSRERFAGRQPTPDEVLDVIIELGLEEALARVEVDGKAGVTIDHVLKAVDGKTKRRHDESQQELLRQLAGGITAAIAGNAAAGELEAGVVEEAEYAVLPDVPEVTTAE